jgi:hypothetical protein
MIGLADEHRGHGLRRLQGFVTKSLRVALPGFRKLYYLVCDCLSGWNNDRASLLESHEGHLKTHAQDTGSVRIEPVALQVMPDRHGTHYRWKFAAVKGNRVFGVELTRRVVLDVAKSRVGRCEKPRWACVSPLPNFCGRS